MGVQAHKLSGLAVAICILASVPRALAQQTPSPQIKSFSVGPDQTLSYPNSQLPGLPDEHTTFMPPASSTAPYLVFGASNLGAGSTGGAVVLETTDFVNFDLAASLGYSPQVMTPPTAIDKCNPTYVTEFDGNYAAPGSVVQDPTLPAGNFIMIYEAENHCPSGVVNFNYYATTGFARSSDGGKTWPAPINGVLGGPARHPVLQSSDPQPSVPHNAEGDAIPSAFVDLDADHNYYLYVVYEDHPASSNGDGLTRVARAQLGVDSPNFLKWYNGSFSQPGIGGSDTGMTPSPGCANGVQSKPSVVYNDDLGLYMLIFVCTNGPTGSRVGAWYYSTATSLSLENWTTPQMIQNSQFTDTQPCPGSTTGGQFDGWYPSAVSPGAAAGHTKLMGYFFFLNGCDTGARQFMSRTFTITPAFTCDYALNLGGQSFAATGGTGTITITTGAGCPWSVSGLPLWITLTSATSGIGNGTVTFQVSPNSGADQSATFTLANQTFTVNQEASTIPGLSFIGSMPHLAAEGGWDTTFTFVNKGATSAIARMGLFAPGGAALALPIDLPQQPASASPLLASSLDQTIAPNASFVMEATGPTTVPYQEGSAQLAATGVVDGFEIFHYDPTNQEAVVPLETRNAPSYLLAFDNTNNVLTGVAIANVSPSAANIPVIIRNDAGAQIDTEVLPLPGEGHTSFVLSTLYTKTANIRGTIEFDTPSGSQISILGIRYTPPGTMTTIPAMANVGASGGLMAHLASADGWQTTFVLVNTGNSSAQAQLNLYGDNGSPLSLPLTFMQTGATSTASSVAQNIAPGASLWVQSTGSPAGSLLTGSAQLTTTGSISGFVIFRYNANGQEAVVPLESRYASAYLLAFDNTSGTATGVAISAVSSQAVSVPVVIRDDTGTQVGTTGTIPLAANGHYSQVLSTLFPATAGIRGTLEFDAPPGAEISILGIRSPPALTFTTLPPLAK